MSSTQQYQGIVFKIAPPTSDFDRGTEIVLPGQHTAREAWRAVFAELRGPRAAELRGGEIRRHEPGA